LPLTLPGFTVDLQAQPPLVRSPADGWTFRADRLRPEELAVLVALDEGTAAPDWPVERLVPLLDQRWAVCRRMGLWCVWRILGSDTSTRIGHPGWLWASDDWLDPHQASIDAHPVPAQLPLRGLLQQALPLHPSGREVIKALAATIRLLRGGAPVAVIVPSGTLANVLHPARFFAMAVLALLPPSWRSTLRVSIGEVAPKPGAWNLVITEEAPETYSRVELGSAPDEGADIVSYYVRERLLADDPEALEATSFQTPPITDKMAEPWTEAVASILRAPPTGVAVLSDEALAADPERVVRSLCARLRAGTDLPLLSEALTRITLATRDLRPWRLIAQRSRTERSDAVSALLAQREALRPTSELIRTLQGTYPSGSPIEPWVTALLAWLHQGHSTAAVVNAVEATLLNWPLTATRATRSSVWSEVIYGLVALGEDDAAMEALVSRVAQEIASEGASRALVANWAIVPPAFRDQDRLERLVRLIATAPDGEQAIVELFRHSMAEHNEASLVCRVWLEERRGHAERDPLFDDAQHTGHLPTWLDALYASQDPLQAATTLQRVCNGPSDPSWIDTEVALTRRLGLGPAHRFLALIALGPGLDALEPLASVWLLDALPRPFPAPELIDVARMLLGTHDPSPLWALVAVMAAPVDHWEDTEIDAAVVDFCAATHDTDVREAAFACAEQLGSAEGFEPLDLARWLVRISLAPDASRITPELALALVRGMLAHPDGAGRLVAVTLALLELPAEHPALLAFVHFLLPQAWDERPPASYRRAIPLDEVPPALQLAWSRAYGGEESC
jgi:hypothetical protein